MKFLIDIDKIGSIIQMKFAAILEQVLDIALVINDAYENSSGNCFLLYSSELSLSSFTYYCV